MRSFRRSSLTPVRRAVRGACGVAALAACYAAAALVGLRFAVPPGNATAVWPASGIALAGVLFLGPWAAPGIFLGSFAANLTTSVGAWGAAAIAAGDTFEALAALWLLTRGGRAPTSWLRDGRSVFGFAAVASAASALAALVGAVTLHAGARLTWPSLALNAATWWLGDIAGIVIVTPLFLALRAERRVDVPAARWAEAALAAVALAAVSQALFGGLLAARRATDLLFLPVFLMMWLALRFDRRAVAGAAILMAAAAVRGTSRGVGAYGGRDFSEAFLALQALMIGYALTGLVLVVTVVRRRRADAVVRRSRNRLARVVAERTADLRIANASLRREVAERTRREEVERLRLAAALDSVGEGIMITDANARITHSNPAFTRMTGYSREEVVGKTPRLLKSGRHDAEFYDQLWRTISRGGVWRGTFVDRRKDASLYDAESTIAPIQETGGGLAGYVAVTRDVTSHKVAERALRDSESRLRTIFDAAAEGIVTIDGDGVVESANAAAGAMLGVPAPELVGRPLWARFAPVPEADGEFVGRREGGAEFRADIVLSELVLEGRRLEAAFIRDATERHARLDAERALLSAREELRLAREIQQRFYPSEAPVVDGFDIAGVSRPAEQAGGDCFDYLPMSEGRLGLVVGDVSGHGLGPALLMSQTQAFLRCLLLGTQDVGEILTRLNEFLLADCGRAQFVTLFLARLDPSRRELVYASGGHQAFLLRAGGAVETLRATAIPLGMRRRGIPAAPAVRLEAGDVLLMTTDGLEETAAPSGEELGRARILETVAARRRCASSEIVAALLERREAFAGGYPQQDDVTILVARVLA